MRRREEFASRMALRRSSAAIMDVPHMPRKEEYAQGIAQKAPSYQQTTQHCKKQMTLFLLLFHLLTNQLIMKMRKNLTHGFGNLVELQGSLVDTMCSYN
jgi:hypothetical protein